MSNKDPLEIFGKTAQGLARNPLGIIALFIVLVYGFASIIIVFGQSMTMYERIPLVYFMILFPILVLGVFVWLVISHSKNLFAPGDFKDEENYVRIQMAAASSLSVASQKYSSNFTHSSIDQAVKLVQDAMSDRRGSNHVDHILWVDDKPDNNIYEREAFQAVGLRFTLAISTDEALQKLTQDRFAAIISDMGREEGPREGYALLDELRKKGNSTPLFFYTSSNSPEHKQETSDHDGQGLTNNPQELFQMVTRSVIRQRAGS